MRACTCADFWGSLLRFQELELKQIIIEYSIQNTQVVVEEGDMDTLCGQMLQHVLHYGGWWQRCQLAT